MASRMLHIFAVNAAVEGRHTYLSRSKEEAMKLPDLAGWMGLRQGGLNTDEIELFPVSDLAGMALSDYVSNAFDLDGQPAGQTMARMNALDGHVLLVPDAAVAGTVETKPELTLIASLPMARADHSSEALEPTKEIYGQPSQDNVGWHSKNKSRSGLKISIILSIFVLIAGIMMALATS